MTFRYLSDACIGLADLLMDLALGWIWRSSRTPAELAIRSKRSRKALLHAAAAFILVLCGLAWLFQGLSLAGLEAGSEVLSWLKPLSFVAVGLVLGSVLRSARAGVLHLSIRGLQIRTGSRQSAWKKLASWWAI